MASVGIIGAGPGGCFAAIEAARRGLAVTLVERNAKPLKKLLVSGNGRGNLLNVGAPRYYGGAAFAEGVLAHVSAADVAALWAELGVPLRVEDEGRAYPAALMASVAADALRLELERLGVALRLNTRAERLEPLPGGWRVALRECPPPEPGAPRGAANPPQKEYTQAFDAVILAAGGQASPALGADGDGCALLAALGHELVPTRPALCALRTETKPLEGLSGLRLRAALTLTDAAGVPLHRADGEALFADDGVSGIAAMQLARFAEPGCALHIDLRPALGCPEAAPAALLGRLRALRETRAAFAADRLLTGWLPAKAAWRLARLAGVAPGTPVGQVPDRALERLAALLCDWPLAVLGPRGWEHAQVTAGGAATAGFDPATLESRRCAGLYAVGETLDVDGDCGGFNLLFACASGALAGRSCIQTKRP